MYIIIQGVTAVIAKSFERIPRSNLIGMGIIPLSFKPGKDAESLGLTGHERYTIDLPTRISDIRPGQHVTVTTDTGNCFACIARFDTKLLSYLWFLCNMFVVYESVNSFGGIHTLICS